MGKSHQMSPIKLVIRCFAEHKDNQWQAVSLEFGLAAQGDTLPAVKRKLESMIQSYVEDALVGPDRDHAETLLSRRAPLSAFAKYHIIRLASKWNGVRDRCVDFQEALALEPRSVAV